MLTKADVVRAPEGWPRSDIEKQIADFNLAVILSSWQDPAGDCDRPMRLPPKTGFYLTLSTLGIPAGITADSFDSLPHL